MKKTILVLLSSFMSLLSISQSRSISYDAHQKEVTNFLNSISDEFYEKSYDTKKLDFSSFIGYSGNKFEEIHGGNVKLLIEPHKDSEHKAILTFGDIFYIPVFACESYPKQLVFSYRTGELSSEVYYFGTTENGEYGFVNGDNIISRGCIKISQNNNYYIYEKWRSIGIVKRDFTKNKIIYADNINFSHDKNSITYSQIASGEEETNKIFILDLNNWTEQCIGTGLSPSFVDDSTLIYWSALKGRNLYEKIYLQNLNEKQNQTIFNVPDSLSLWSCPGDYYRPEELEVIKSKNTIYISFKLYEKTPNMDGEEIGTYKININGEIIEIKKPRA